MYTQNNKNNKKNKLFALGIQETLLGIDSTTNEYKLRKFVYWHKVDELPPEKFKMGANMKKHNTIKQQRIYPTASTFM